MNRLTNLTDQELAIYLAKIRRIARMEDNDAMAEIDELAFNLAQRGLVESVVEPESDNFELEEARDELREFERELKQYRGKLTRDDVDEWEIHDLDERAGSLGDWRNQDVVQKLGQKVSVLKEEASSLIKGLWISYGKGKLKDFDRDLKRLSNSAKRKLDHWRLEAIVSHGDDLGSDWESDVTKMALANEIQERKDSARAVAIDLYCLKAAQEIQNSKKEILHTVSSTKRVLKQLSEAENTLTSHSRLTETLVGEIRRERERCALFRAQKKLLAADIAQKAGESKKSTKLNLEAEALLEDDWKCVFPDEPAPNISDL